MSGLFKTVRKNSTKWNDNKTISNDNYRYILFLLLCSIFISSLPEKPKTQKRNKMERNGNGNGTERYWKKLPFRSFPSFGKAAHA